MAKIKEKNVKDKKKGKVAASLGDNVSGWTLAPMAPMALMAPMTAGSSGVGIPPPASKRGKHIRDKRATAAQTIDGFTLPDPATQPHQHAQFKEFNLALLAHGVFFAWIRKVHGLGKSQACAQPPVLQLPLCDVPLNDLHHYACSRVGSLMIKVAVLGGSNGHGVSTMQVSALTAARVLLGQHWAKHIHRQVQARLTQCRNNQHAMLDGFQTASLIHRSPACGAQSFMVNLEAMNCPFVPCGDSDQPKPVPEPPVVATREPQAKPSSSFSFMSLSPSPVKRAAVPHPISSSDSEHSPYIWSSSSTSDSEDSSSDSEKELSEPLRSPHRSDGSAPIPPSTTHNQDPPPALPSPKVLARPATNKKEWYQATTTFNRAMAVYTLLFAYVAHTHGQDARVPIPTATHSRDFAVFANAMIHFAHNHLNLPVPYILVHKDGVDFRQESLNDVLYTLFGRKERRRHLTKGIKEHIHGIVTGEQVCVPAVHLSALAPLVPDAREPGVWVLNWATARKPYVQTLSSTPQPAPARASRSKLSRSGACHQDVPPPALHDTPSAAGDFGQPPLHRPGKRPLPVDSDPGTDADIEDDLMVIAPAAQRPRVAPVALLAGPPPRPKTLTPPAPLGLPRPCTTVSPAAAAPEPASAPALVDRERIRHLAQINVTRLQLRQSHRWATDTWFFALKESMRDMAGEAFLSMGSLRQCAAITARHVGPAETEEEEEARAITMVPQVVAHALLQPKFPGIAFEYVDALVEAAVEMGLGVTAQTLEVCASMFMEE